MHRNSTLRQVFVYWIWLLISAYPTDCFTERTKQTNKQNTLILLTVMSTGSRSQSALVRCPHSHTDLASKMLASRALTLVTFPGMSSSPSRYTGARSHTPLTSQSDGIVLEKQITFFQGKVSLLTNSFQPVLLRQLSCMEFRGAASCKCCCFFVCSRKRQDCWFYHCLALEEGNSCRPWEAAAFKKVRGPFDI